MVPSGTMMSLGSTSSKIFIPTVNIAARELAVAPSTKAYSYSNGGIESPI
jgi:hypothetical protein